MKKTKEKISGLIAPELSENAVKVLENRYLVKDERGNPLEDPADLFRRVSDAIAEAEDVDVREYWAEHFYNLMAGGYFMPNSPTLMNAGRSMGMLSACFVLPVEDSIDGIFTTLKNVALVQKAGGGTGFDFSKLRPDGDLVKSSGGKTSGPLSFIDTYSAGTEAIQQGAFRRGANMGVMRCDHPDVIEFIRAKDDLNRWTNYNVSVSVTNEWMRNVKENGDEPAIVVNPRTKKKAFLKKREGRKISSSDYEAYELSIGEGVPVKEIEWNSYWTYSEVFGLITDLAWKNGEPGLLFLDRANKDNPTPHLGDLEATNPCGEQWLLPYASCNLGSINLGRYYQEGPNGWRNSINWDQLDNDITTAVRFLDDVVTVNNYPIPEMREMADKERRIGLGVMGFADLLFDLGVPYGSTDSIEIAKEMSSFLYNKSREASEELVLTDRRAPFEAWEGSAANKEGKNPRRNSVLTTVAPTGTISIIAGCSGGIEPVFSLAYKRQVMKNEDGEPVVMIEINPRFKKALIENGYSTEAIEEIVDVAMMEGTVANANLPKFLKERFVTARDVGYEKHIEMQAAWQKNIDNSVSKTINLPSSATKGEVKNSYLKAFELGCKGITVYRDGCREMQPMSLKEPVKASEVKKVVPAPVPDVLPCLRMRQATPFGNLHAKITYDPVTGNELEIFAQVGKGGEIVNSDLEAMCRIASLYLRTGGKIESILNQWEGIGSTITLPTREGKVTSIGDAMAKAIRKYLNHKRGFSDTKARDNDVMFKLECPECHSISVIKSEGCTKCENCGWSAC